MTFIIDLVNACKVVRIFIVSCWRFVHRLQSYLITIKFVTVEWKMTRKRIVEMYICWGSRSRLGIMTSSAFRCHVREASSQKSLSESTLCINFGKENYLFLHFEVIESNRIWNKKFWCDTNSTNERHFWIIRISISTSCSLSL